MSKYSPSDCQCLRWTVLVVSLPQNSLKHTIQQLTWTSWDLHFHHPEIILYHQEPWRTYTKVKHDSQCSSFSVGFWLKWIRFWVSCQWRGHYHCPPSSLTLAKHQLNKGMVLMAAVAELKMRFWNASTRQVCVCGLEFWLCIWLENNSVS